MVETKLRPELVHFQAENYSLTCAAGVAIVLTGVPWFSGRQTFICLIARSDIKRVYCVAVRRPEVLTDQL